MAQGVQTNPVYTPGKPPLPPSALKRLQFLKESRKVFPILHDIDAADGNSGWPSIISTPPPDGLASPPASCSPLSKCRSSSIIPPPPVPSFSPRGSRSLGSWKIALGPCVPGEVLEAWDRLFHEETGADVLVSTQDGGHFSAHSNVLAASSPVWKARFEWKPRGSYNLEIPGVPFDCARGFIRFVYSSRFDQEEMGKYVLHWLVLSHAYCVPASKRVCVQQLERRLLSTENVVDVMQLARLCDAPRLNLVCVRFVITNFKSVARSEGWKAMRENDPSLEQELVEAVIEVDTKKQEKIRKGEEEKVYAQLSDAMEALVHICRDGCRTIVPHDKTLEQGACSFVACKGLESLVRHFAGCKLKVSGGCVHCKRMWQLLELHSRMCGDTASCKIPLCSHFKNREGLPANKKEEARWKLLINKVVAAKGVASSFSLAAVSARLEQVV